MSVQKHKNGYIVRWSEAGRMRSKVFARKGDADTFDLDRKRRRQLGPALAGQVLDQGDLMTLAEFVAGPWSAHAVTLSPGSRAKYAWALEKHLAELLDEPLVAITVPVLAAHQQTMLTRRPPASANTVREAFMYLASILQVAVEFGRLPSNPARGLRKTQRHVRAEKDALDPVEVERLIAAATGRDRAILILGGRLGLRPVEIRLIPWSALDGDQLHVRAVDTKSTAARPRDIEVDRASAADLRAWRLESGGRGGDTIVGPMTDVAIKQWGTKRLRPRATAATDGRIPKASTNTLRHSHASALHYAGFTLAEAARRMGHAQETHVLHYSHMLGRGRRADGLDALYAAARAEAATPGAAGVQPS